MKEIKLTQGKVALVDDEDFEYLNQWRWHAFKHGKTYYAIRNDYSTGVHESIRMHRLLLGLNKQSDLVGDHIDGNGLNNQRSNIRACTQLENAANRRGYGLSKYLGVHYNHKSKRWRSKINNNHQRTNIGYFKTEENAATAYNIFAEKLHGKFARFNKPTT